MVTLTDDGVLFAKNSDRDPNEAQLLEWVPAADHPPATRVPCTWIDDPPGRPHPRRPALPAVVDVGRRDGGQRARRGHRQRGRLHRPSPTASTGLLGMDLLRLGPGAGRHGRGRGLGHGRAARAPRPGRPVQPRAARVHLRQQLPGGRPVRRLRAGDRRVANGPPSVVERPGRSISNGLTIPAFADAHADRSAAGSPPATSAGPAPRPLAAGRRRPADLMAALRTTAPTAAPAGPRSTAGWARPASTPAGWWPRARPRRRGCPTSAAARPRTGPPPPRRRAPRCSSRCAWTSRSTSVRVPTNPFDPDSALVAPRAAAPHHAARPRAPRMRPLPPRSRPDRGPVDRRPARPADGLRAAAGSSGGGCRRGRRRPPRQPAAVGPAGVEGHRPGRRVVGADIDQELHP